jgi:RNA polymerase sigma-70 factor, ECF subfamily
VTAAEGVASPTPEMSFDGFVRAHRHHLENVLALSWPREDVQDAVQEAMMQAHAEWETVRAMASPTGWVVTVARRRLIRWSTRDRTYDHILKNAVSDLVTSVVTPDPGDQLGNRDLLKQALGCLKDSYADAVVLHDLLDLSIEDTARTLGVPVSTAKTHAHRGRTKLRAILESQALQAGGMS